MKFLRLKSLVKLIYIIFIKMKILIQRSRIDRDGHGVILASNRRTTSITINQRALGLCLALFVIFSMIVITYSYTGDADRKNDLTLINFDTSFINQRFNDISLFKDDETNCNLTTR